MSLPLFRTAGFALLALEALFVVLYAQTEQTFYFWDQTMYFDMARQLYHLAQTDLSKAFEVFQSTLSTNYPALFALPDILAFSLFGESRQVFLLSHFFFFAVPLQIAAGLLLRRGFGLEAGPAFLLSILLFAVTPPLWNPLLEGYPDHAAAALLLFGLLPLAAPKRRWTGAVGLGLAFGLAILFRRHYAYAVLAILAVGGLLDLIGACRTRRPKTIGALIGFYLLAGLVLVGLMAAIAPVYLTNALTVNYTALYLSYKVEAVIFLQSALNSFGVLFALLAAGGLLGASITLPFARILLGSLILWLALWSLGPAQTGTHYVLQFPALASLFGLAGLYLLLHRLRRPFGVALPFLALAFLFGNAAYSLWFAPEGVVPNWRGQAGLLAAPHPPEVRADYEEMIKLAAHLQQTAGAEDRIVAVGSSFVFNQDILRFIYTDLLKRPEAMRLFLQAPEVDVVQRAPYDLYASATIFAVPEPAQYHLDPEGQKVVTALARLFPPQGLAAPLFQKDEAVFTLKDGVKVSVWRRTKPWPPEALLKTAQLMEVTLGPSTDSRFSAHRSWIVTRLPWLAESVTLSDKTSLIQGLFGEKKTELSAFYNRRVEKGVYRLRTLLRTGPNCANPSAQLEQILPNGEQKLLAKMPVTGQEMMADFTATAPLYVGLSLHVENRGADPCPLLLQNLDIMKTGL